MSRRLRTPSLGGWLHRNETSRSRCGSSPRSLMIARTSSAGSGSCSSVSTDASAESIRGKTVTSGVSFAFIACAIASATSSSMSETGPSSHRGVSRSTHRSCCGAGSAAAQSGKRSASMLASTSGASLSIAARISARARRRAGAAGPSERLAPPLCILLNATALSRPDDHAGDDAGHGRDDLAQLAHGAVSTAAAIAASSTCHSLTRMNRASSARTASSVAPE